MHFNLVEGERHLFNFFGRRAWLHHYFNLAGGGGGQISVAACDPLISTLPLLILLQKYTATFHSGNCYMLLQHFISKTLFVGSVCCRICLKS